MMDSHAKIPAQFDADQSLFTAALRSRPAFLKSRLSSQCRSRRAAAVTLWPGRSPR